MFLLLFSIQMFNLYQWLTFDTTQFEKSFNRKVDENNSFEQVQSYMILFTIIPMTRLALMLVLSIPIALSIRKPRNVWIYLNLQLFIIIISMWYCFGPLFKSIIWIEYIYLNTSLTIMGYFFM